MHLVTVSAYDLLPCRIAPLRNALSRFFGGRLAWLEQHGRVLGIGQHQGDDDHTDVDQLRLDVAQIVLRAHCGPCAGSIMSYEIQGPSLTLGDAARSLGLDQGRLSAVDQLGQLTTVHRPTHLVVGDSSRIQE